MWDFRALDVGALSAGWMGGERFEGWGGKGVIRLVGDDTQRYALNSEAP